MTFDIDFHGPVAFWVPSCEDRVPFTSVKAVTVKLSLWPVSCKNWYFDVL